MVGAGNWVTFTPSRVWRVNARPKTTILFSGGGPKGSCVRHSGRPLASPPGTCPVQKIPELSTEIAVASANRGLTCRRVGRPAQSSENDASRSSMAARTWRSWQVAAQRRPAASESRFGLCVIDLWARCVNARTSLSTNAAFLRSGVDGVRQAVMKPINNHCDRHATPTGQSRLA